jgi:AcrR family transcriptional regulator
MYGVTGDITTVCLRIGVSIMATTSGRLDGGRERNRPVGRPKLKIDPADVAAVATSLYDQRGVEAVSIESVADGLGVSRATLYRTVRSVDALHGIILDRVVRDVERDARAVLEANPDPRDALEALIRFQVGASIRMRNYVGFYFGWGLQKETYNHWRKWASGYEALWCTVVANAMEAGHLRGEDPVLTTRLVLGMVNWVSRWYSSAARYDADQIADAALQLVLAPS